MAKKKAASVVSLKLTDSEQDLLSQMQQGYQLETDSLGSDPISAPIERQRSHPPSPIGTASAVGAAFPFSVYNDISLV